jgi:hypothetical protein
LNCTFRAHWGHGFGGAASPPDDDVPLVDPLLVLPVPLLELPELLLAELPVLLPDEELPEDPLLPAAASPDDAPSPLDPPLELVPPATPLLELEPPASGKPVLPFPALEPQAPAATAAAMHARPAPILLATPLIGLFSMPMP